MCAPSPLARPSSTLSTVAIALARPNATVLFVRRSLGMALRTVPSVEKDLARPHRMVELVRIGHLMGISRPFATSIGPRWDNFGQRPSPDRPSKALRDARDRRKGPRRGGHARSAWRKGPRKGLANALVRRKRPRKGDFARLNDFGRPSMRRSGTIKRCEARHYPARARAAALRRRSLRDRRSPATSPTSSSPSARAPRNRFGHRGPRRSGA